MHIVHKPCTRTHIHTHPGISVAPWRAVCGWPVPGLPHGPPQEPSSSTAEVAGRHHLRVVAHGPAPSPTSQREGPPPRLLTDKEVSTSFRILLESSFQVLFHGSFMIFEPKEKKRWAMYRIFLTCAQTQSPDSGPTGSTGK